MEDLTIGLAITALIVAVLVAAFDVAFFIAQSRQAREMTKNNAESAEKMAGFLGELRGQTTVIGDRVQLQFDKVLNAFIQGRDGGVYEEEASLAGDTGVAGLNLHYERAERLATAYDDKLSFEILDTVSREGYVPDIPEFKSQDELLTYRFSFVARVGVFIGMGLLIEEDGAMKLSELGKEVYRVVKEKRPKA